MFTIGVFAIILDTNKKILLCHRRDHDLWNLPGGTLELDESVEQAVIREVKEETGLDVEVEKLTGVYSKKSRDDLAFSFLCSKLGGEITLNDEADKIEYFDLQSIPKNFSPNQLERLNDYFNNQEKTHYKVQTGRPSIELIKEGKL